MRSLRPGRPPQIAALLIVIAFTSTLLRADSIPAGPPADPDEEPTSEIPVLPQPGDETGPLHPFDPPAESDRAVMLDALTDDDQAYVVANEGGDDWVSVHSGFSAATHEIAVDADAQAAANALGIAGIATIGVTP